MKCKVKVTSKFKYNNDNITNYWENSDKFEPHLQNLYIAHTVLLTLPPPQKSTLMRFDLQIYERMTDLDWKAFISQPLKDYFF